MNLPRGASCTSNGERLREFALFITTGFTAYLCWLLAHPFVPAFAWAFALGVAVRPVHRRLVRRLGSANGAALLSLMLAGAAILAPAALLISRLMREAIDAANWIQGAVDSGQWAAALEKYSLFGASVERLKAEVDLGEGLQKAATTAAGWASSLISGSAWVSIQLVMMMLALFYFLRDERAILDGLQRISPLSKEETTALLTHMVDVVHASLYGNVVVKLLQGFLGGLMFWVLGLPESLLWGAVMAILAVVPIFGTAVVWLPAAFVLAWQGHWIKALVLLAWGAAVISTIDNVIYPLLVGTELRLHTLSVFIAVVGGLAAFGTSGVVLGPMILALAMALADVWRQRGARILEDQPTTIRSAST